MKLTVRDKVFIFLLTLCVMALLSLCSSCTHTKDVAKSTYDSTYEDSLRTVTEERDLYKKYYEESIYAGIVFDTIVNHDTINHFNTVYLTPEGGIEAKGNIKRVDFSKTALTKIIQDKQRVIDSLRVVKSQVKTVTITKHKKTSFVPFWVFLVMGGLVLFAYRKQLIKLI